MFAVKDYMARMIQGLKQNFGDRFLYAGLQGSYLRGEATESSDLDVVVVIDGLTTEDLFLYRNLVSALPDPEKACGFICGRQELANWNPLEICGLVYGTEDHYGRLADYVPAYTKEDVANFLKLSVGNMYHELCHRYIHADAEKNKRNLPGTYKGVFFILQSLYYWKEGRFYLTKREMLPHLCPEDRLVLETAERLRSAVDYDFEEAFGLLFSWCQRLLPVA